MEYPSLFSMIQFMPNVSVSPFWSILTQITESQIDWPDIIPCNSTSKIIEGLKFINNIEYDECRAMIMLNFIDRSLKEHKFETIFSDDLQIQQEVQKFIDISSKNPITKEYSTLIRLKLTQSNDNFLNLLNNLDSQFIQSNNQQNIPISINTKRTNAPRSSIALFYNKSDEKLNETDDSYSSPNELFEECSPEGFSLVQEDFSFESQKKPKKTKKNIKRRNIDYFDMPAAVADASIDMLYEEMLNYVNLYRNFLVNVISEVHSKVIEIKTNKNFPEIEDSNYQRHIEEMERKLDDLMIELDDCMDKIGRVEENHLKMQRRIQSQLNLHWRIMNTYEEDFLNEI
ncbi:hypothetical protein TVAG_114240 [Trichomonas vaginalis G3]|uniref:Uncharacterized protein n=1 Tax=Trichomonas vaginalis (strain ATCC PRA-98 / G3) TaxID=412133 RepID=A2F3V1_TRIV3|nr:hypothetical protein TVAGG3_0281240 [Trichomonas vaginalis G3]EAY00420.1 hypothetical protein TVAG_114240 [Trichomonas vaginalis G3]KAI5526561.1 hypothetical protein TVAGG3_0281240 [Trichomonas vaginalis G3]|eukprot:XP_001313349.1 hypothetical protein [Trichomonas vaginalis G3]